MYTRLHFFQLYSDSIITKFYSDQNSIMNTTLKITIDSHVHHYIQYATELNYYHNNLFSTIPESGGGIKFRTAKGCKGGEIDEPQSKCDPVCLYVKSCNWKKFILTLSSYYFRIPRSKNTKSFCQLFCFLSSIYSKTFI